MNSILNLNTPAAILATITYLEALGYNLRQTTLGPLHGNSLEVTFEPTDGKIITMTILVDVKHPLI